ncbi:MAG: threonine synthase [Gammaproteobacteria bacterium]|nr:threonine synthase [Pseudomonadales bacterium]MCP5346566.1 threonine synthase [Pseudomonadales bacterium]
MKYISTRGGGEPQDFEQVLLTGLAPDGGLYVPASLPSFSRDEIAGWSGLPYNELALQVIRPFVADTIAEADLRRCVDESYAGFSHRAVAPLTMLDSNEWTLELFHGPTLAFKDFALQVLGRLLDHVLTRNDQRVAILGATSGDTGSAALEGCRHSERVDIFILHPHQRISEVQRRQMTTVEGDNVHNLAIRGNFDDCQKIVKTAFSNQDFLPAGRQLVAVNSINWARIMVQIAYYFYAAVNLGGPHRPLSFSVPTGNFGDIYAGYLARQMGLPVDQLVVATNRNDILHRFISGNSYQVTDLAPTYSPSMDIMVSSNFERFLYDLFDRDPARLRDFMARSNSESLQVDEAHWQRVRENFSSYAVSDEQTCAMIRQVYDESGVLLDPHTAVGVKAARECRSDPQVPMVTLATAHPVKFADAIKAAGIPTPPLPAHLSDLMERPERCTVLDNSVSAVTGYLSSHLRA